MFLVPQDDMDLEGPDDRWHEQWDTVVEEPTLNYSHTLYAAPILKGIVCVMAESPMPHQNQGGRWETASWQPPIKKKWSFVTAPCNRSSCHIPERITGHSSMTWVRPWLSLGYVASGEMFKIARTLWQNHSPLYPQLEWKFHEAKVCIWLVHCCISSTWNSAWHTVDAQ